MKTHVINSRYPSVITDCPSWFEGQQKNPRTTALWIRTYHSEEVVKSFVNSVYVDGFAYIRHDKDLLPDGSLKAPHIHLLVKLSAQVSLTAVCKAFNGQQTFVQLPYSMPVAYRYLTHSDNPDKYQYLEEDITSTNSKVLQLTPQEQADERNSEFLTDCIENVPMREMAIKYGRDYMKNYRYYKEFVRDMQSQEDITKLAHWIGALSSNEAINTRPRRERAEILANHLTELILGDYDISLGDICNVLKDVIADINKARKEYNPYE